MRHIRFVVTLVVLTALATASAAPPTTAAAAGADPLARLKAMAGEWQAKLPNGDTARLSSKVASGGSAVMETLNMHGDMVTAYHRDGERLMLTHYCVLGNQPRMQAKPSADGKELAFKFVDATNLPDAKDPHMRELKITFVDDNHVTQEWTLFQDGKPVETATFAFERVK